MAAIPAMADTKPKPKAPIAAAKPIPGTPMVYFRYSSLNDCNVYMNYSYVSEPKFTLKAFNPQALSATEAAFIDKFNAAFAAMIARHPDACHYEGNPYTMSYGEQETLLRRCLAQEKIMGYSEAGWATSRLSAPTNCISYRDDMAGVINLIPGTLPQPKMSIEAWMAKANAGR